MSTNRAPSIVVENWSGQNNTEERYAAYKKMGAYRNLSTVWITPTRGTMQTKVAFNWLQVAGGFNQPLVRMCVEGCEVGAAYNYAIKEVLNNPGLKDYKYILTVEEDNTAPPNGLQLLYESIQEVDGVSGLYWTKGPGGCPQIWGDIKGTINFVPQTPIPDSLQRCWGIGMGFSLYRMDMFRNPGFVWGEWFKTCTNDDLKGVATQDLYFCTNAAKLGYKFAVDTRCKVGHCDNSGILW